MIRYYCLKRASHRKFVDLTDYEIPITLAVSSVFPHATIVVYENFFEIKDSQDNLTNRSKLQQMGRQISYFCTDLRSLVKQYGLSRQLFMQMK